MQLPQFPGTNIEILLYENVSNVDAIRSRVVELPYAFIDASAICSVEQIMSAIYRVMIEAKYNRLRTKSLHSEILLALSPTSNIGEAFKRFGLKENTKNLFMIQITQDKTSNVDKTLVKGDIIEFKDESIERMSDIETIKKIYKIDQSLHLKNNTQLSRAVVDAIQLRGL